MTNKEKAIIRFVATEFLKQYPNKGLKTKYKEVEVTLFYDEEKESILIGFDKDSADVEQSWSDDEKADVVMNMCMSAAHAFCLLFEERKTVGTLSNGERFEVSAIGEEIDIKIFEDDTTLQ